MSSRDCKELLITADAHVGETDDMIQRVPEEFRERIPRMSLRPDGALIIEVGDRLIEDPPAAEFDDRVRRLEFRNDPSLGTDLASRYRDMAVEGVDGQVIFPNLGLGCNAGLEPPEFHAAWARAYNDFVWEVFADDRKRFKLAAMIAVEDIEIAIAEATRCVEKGFSTLFLPCSMPWQPYRLKIYEPLWRFAEEARIPLNFHVFSGNLSPLGGDFAQLGAVTPERYQRAQQLEDAYADEQLGTTVMGIASGMSPVVELTGSGVLERHPDLRFVITEADCGWLAWVLQALDQMQERRAHYLDKLSLRASDYFRRQGFITITDDPVALHNVEFTGTDCLLWGNDYPHDEGTFPESRQGIDRIVEKLGPETARSVLSGHAAELFGFDLKYLQNTHVPVATA